VAADTIRSAFQSLGGGDVEPLVALIHPDMEWRARRRLPRFWKPPS
jgi:ketosteroid isomerase-like protein